MKQQKLFIILLICFFSTLSCTLSKDIEKSSFTLNIPRQQTNLDNVNTLEDGEYYLIECTVLAEKDFTQTKKIYDTTEDISFTFEQVPLQKIIGINVKVYFVSDFITYLKYVGSLDKEIIATNSTINVNLTEYKKENKDNFVFVQGAKIKVLDKSYEPENIYSYRTVFIKDRELDIKDFYISKEEVTNKEYKEIISDYEYSNPDNYSGLSINWCQAIIYCNLRSIKENLQPCYSMLVNNKYTTDTTKWKMVSDYSDQNIVDWICINCDYNANGYRLPTEVEWEYAMREGITMNKNNTYDANEWEYNNSTSTYELKNKKDTTNKLGIIQNTPYDEFFWDIYTRLLTTNTYLTGPSISYETIIQLSTIDSNIYNISRVLKGSNSDITDFSYINVYTIISGHAELRLVRSRID